MEDPLDIALSVDDVKSMDPEMVVAAQNKLRQSRNDMRTERDQVRQDVQKVRSENAMLQVRLSEALAREARQQRRLAAVGERMIALGVLDALSLNVEGGK